MICKGGLVSRVRICCRAIKRTSYRGRNSMNKVVGFRSLLVVALLCGISTPRANAQAVYGSILGTVADPQGAAVVNAKVTVTDQNKGTTQATTTNDSGNYTLTHVMPATYSVKADAQG